MAAYNSLIFSQIHNCFFSLLPCHRQVVSLLLLFHVRCIFTYFFVQRHRNVGSDINYRLWKAIWIITFMAPISLKGHSTFSPCLRVNRTCLVSNRWKGLARSHQKCLWAHPQPRDTAPSAITGVNLTPPAARRIKLVIVQSLLNQRVLLLISAFNFDSGSWKCTKTNRQYKTHSFRNHHQFHLRTPVTPFYIIKGHLQMTWYLDFLDVMLVDILTENTPNTTNKWIMLTVAKSHGTKCTFRGPLLSVLI